MRKMLSRKFLCLILMFFLTWIMYGVTLRAAPDVLSPTVFITILSTQTLFGMAYIGGNTWQKYIEMQTGKTGEPGVKLQPMAGSALDRIKAKGQ